MTGINSVNIRRSVAKFLIGPDASHMTESEAPQRWGNNPGCRVEGFHVHFELRFSMQSSDQNSLELTGVPESLRCSLQPWTLTTLVREF